ncbi:MerR family transcriptional regulator [Clostridium botulinum D/C]|uniref:MerR family transcriptional regulator n=1 Tax=Clostridium botulinum TaxID=1491 RepID=UPI001E50AB42|nr:MerR family transcriptional regulator [Clostridium botulinum]MCD3319532.1 MerR family transcriptional regulator [Clostridium botulinum D/C]MCD3324890.1 MerR family transcriptional regulator [Clostridium botulinum D/C]MCD3327720.1 MerR family transcriptional regulator [Clostridium botulinum D/C]
MSNIIDTDYTEINSSTKEEYLTIDEVSKLLKVEEFKVIYWCNKFNDILKIQSIGMYSIFNHADIDNLKTIKHLDLDKKMNTKQIRDYIVNNKSKGIIVKKDNNELTNVSLVQVMAKIINLQNQQISDIKTSNNEILEMNKQLIKMQEEFKNGFMDFCTQISKDRQKENNLIYEQISVALSSHNEALERTKSELKDYISATIEDKLEANTDNLKAHIDATTENTNKEIEKVYNKDIELVNDLKRTLEKRKEEIMLQKNNGKGFFNRFFHKK